MQNLVVRLKNSALDSLTPSAYETTGLALAYNSGWDRLQLRSTRLFAARVFDHYARCIAAQSQLDPKQLDDYAVVVVAHNEEQRIGPRIENLLAADYPPGQIEIILVSDGSTDATAARAREAAGARGRVIERVGRSGKAACLNAGVAEARGGIIVYADARQLFGLEAIAELVARLRAECDEVVAADGGSTDDTCSLAAAAGAPASPKCASSVFWPM